MSRAQSHAVRPAPTTNSTVHNTPVPQPPNWSFFRPFPQLPEQWRSPQAQDELLSQYIRDTGTFFAFAKARGLSVDQLYDWLHSEEIVDRQKRLAQVADERAAFIARLNRPAAINRLAEVMNDPNTHPNQRRLAASAILRAASAADRRDERKPHAVPLSSGSSGTQCPYCTPAPSRPDSVSRVPSSHARSAGTPPARLMPGGNAESDSTDSHPTTQVLARIGLARSPVPPRDRPRGRASPHRRR